MQKERGFTLIELIIVIVILGILAVTAAPRFFDFSKDARISTLGGLKAALQGAANIEYAKNAIQGSPSYPEAVDQGQPNSIVDATQISATDWVITPGANNIRFSVKEGASARANCHVNYSYTTSLPDAPLISVTNSGC